MAAARQKEMKVSITVVATKTLAAGRRMLVLLDIAPGSYATAGTHVALSAFRQTMKITHRGGGFQWRYAGFSAPAGRLRRWFPRPAVSEKPRHDAGRRRTVVGR